MRATTVIVSFTVLAVVVGAVVAWRTEDTFTDHGWQDCSAPSIADVPSLGELGSEPAERRLGVEKIADVDQATGLVEAADGSLVVAAKPGVLYRIVDGDAHRIAGFPVSSGAEQGLLDVELDPARGVAYLTLTDPDGDLVLLAMDLDTNGVPVPGSDRPLMVIDQPHEWHNGGSMELDEAGHLWIGVGDGGEIADPMRVGQSVTGPLASVLRIEPTTDGYRIPDDNPFVDEAADPRVVAHGFRNPWSIDIDPETGLVWVADVGQNCMEEVNVIDPADLGGNHGWSRLEGTHRFRGDIPAEHVLPVFEYHHDDGGCSITGGGVYRGETIPWLAGSYVFADYCRGGLTALTLDGTHVTGVLELGPRFGLLGAIETDAAGELYLLTMNEGIWQVVG